jgi:hypothetical protein
MVRNKMKPENIKKGKWVNMGPNLIKDEKREMSKHEKKI